MLCLAALLFTLPARAAVDIFLDFLPTIPGESQDSTYANKVDVLAWSWGMSQSGTTHLGPGSGAGKVSVQDISITKFVDKASPRLMEYCANGAKLTSAFLIVRKAGTTNTYIKITMADIIVAGVSSGGSGGEDRLTENIVLNFARVKFEYFPTKADGTPDPNAPAPFTWNIPQNISTWE
ncbi:MAG: type VI secretion system tube protein Hcp [Verrucomicrobiota bacterium]